MAQYLIKMQGLESNIGEKMLWTIAAMNERAMIDGAILRRRRFDGRILVTLPSIKERNTILRRPVMGGLHQLISTSHNWLG